MMGVDLNKAINRAVFNGFRKKGLYLKADAAKYLVETLAELGSKEDIEQTIREVADAIDKENAPGAMLDIDTLRNAVIRVAHAQNDDEKDAQPADYFSVVDAFQVPKLKFDPDRKRFFPTTENKCTYAAGEEKGKIFRNRHAVILQRLQRHPLFMPPLVEFKPNESSVYYKIIAISSLNGRASNEDDEGAHICLLGMLSQITENQWYLEDPTGSVKLDLSEVEITTGLFTETSIVIAHGRMVGDKFRARYLSHAPAEPKKATLDIYPDVNFTGATVPKREAARLLAWEKKDDDAFFVFLSDVWLDKPDVQEKLRRLLAGYAGSPPVAFVFMGNFCSAPHGDHHMRALKDGFEMLGGMIAEHDAYREGGCKFIFVPGPLDPGPGNILPRPHLPNFVTERFVRRIPNAVFTSNPCRIQYCTQEIVVFREDLLSKMQRHCVLPPNNSPTIDPHLHLLRTVLEQSHLCPLPQTVRPVYWGFDQSMRLYPLPDALVIGDRTDQFQADFEEVNCMNPSSFANNGFSFMAYWPADKRTEVCKIP